MRVEEAASAGTCFSGAEEYHSVSVESVVP